ncbi:KSR2 Kinase, partial [Psilopogon haemacephalus]|nr:KSR2 Kinase [Psilopogon haemacephalus]
SKLVKYFSRQLSCKRKVALQERNAKLEGFPQLLHWFRIVDIRKEVMEEIAPGQLSLEELLDMTDDEVCATIEKFGANSEECARLNASLSCLRTVHKSGGSLSKQDWTIQWPTTEPGKENSPGCQAEPAQWGRTHLLQSPKVQPKCGGQNHCHAGSGHAPLYGQVDRLTRHAAHTPPRTPNIVTTMTPPGTPPLRRRNKLKPPGTPPPSSRKLIHLIPGFTALHRSKSHEFQLGHRVDEAHTPKRGGEKKNQTTKPTLQIALVLLFSEAKAPLMGCKLKSPWQGWVKLKNRSKILDKAHPGAGSATLPPPPPPRPPRQPHLCHPAQRPRPRCTLPRSAHASRSSSTCQVLPAPHVHPCSTRDSSACQVLPAPHVHPCSTRVSSTCQVLPAPHLHPCSTTVSSACQVLPAPHLHPCPTRDSSACQVLPAPHLHTCPTRDSSTCQVLPAPHLHPCSTRDSSACQVLPAPHLHPCSTRDSSTCQVLPAPHLHPCSTRDSSACQVLPAPHLHPCSTRGSSTCQNEEGTEEAQESEDDFEEMNLSLLSARNFPRKASQTSIFLQEWDIPFEQLEIGELIGKGRFGQVFHGRWHGEVAIRLIDIERDNEDQLKAFKREVMAYRQTRHENVVLFMGACMSPPHLAIITSLCKGRTLYSVVRDAKIVLDVNKTRQIAQEIVKGMGYLHAKGILHKDLKSKNVFYDNGKVVITDFGLFSISGVLQAGRRENKLRIQNGWLCHLAPEIIRQLSPDTEEDKLPFSKHSDVFALGTIWYELHAREWPFKTQPAEAIIWQVGRGMKPNLSQIGMGKEISDILLFCWAYEQEERPTFTKLMDMLEKLPKRNRRLSHPGHFWKSAE